MKLPTKKCTNRKNGRSGVDVCSLIKGEEIIVFDSHEQYFALEKSMDDLIARMVPYGYPEQISEMGFLRWICRS